MNRLKVRKYAIGALTFSAALSIGFILQYGDAVASRSNTDTTSASLSDVEFVDLTSAVSVSAAIAMPQSLKTPVAAERAVEFVSLDNVPTEMESPNIILPSGLGSFNSNSAEIEMISVSLDISQIATPTIPAVPESNSVEFSETIAEDNCDITVFASAMTMATVLLSIDAPCQPSTEVKVSHQGVSFDVMTDEDGLASADIPALSENAVFSMSFESGESAIAETRVTDFSDYDRAVLQWVGKKQIELHALEFGATYGEGGHIWRGDKGQFEGATTGVNGMLTELGQNQYHAEVYTFPSSMVVNAGDVILSIEAEVTLQNCGRELTAQTLQFGPNKSVIVEDLAMTMPDCNAIGEFIVLKNMLEDLTLAER